MKYTKNITLLFLLAFVYSSTILAQIETRLATQCATKSLEVPIILKNLENIKAFELKLLFDNDVLSFDTSLYHQKDFELNTDEIYKIKTTASNDTITIKWNAYYAVNLTNDLLLSVVFNEIGTGLSAFSWIEEECSFTDINGLNIDANYVVDNDVVIPFESNVKIDFEQFTIGCRDDSENGGCKAQVEVNITGGSSPYIYKWNDKFNQNDSIAIGLCQDPVSVKITDNAGCIFADLFDPVIYPAAKYEIKAEPEEVYITKPLVDFSIVTDDEYIEKYEWDFGDENQAFTENATHVYSQVDTYDVSLKTENIDGCDTIVYLKNFEVKELNFCIPNVFTPNGDGINDTWIYKIVGPDGGGDTGENGLKRTGLSEVKKCTGDDLIFSDHFKTTELLVYNRNGSKVFECTNCMDNWDGGGLPDGVYFYVFTWEGEYSNGKENGNVTILGAQQ